MSYVGVDKTYLTLALFRVVSKSEKTSGTHIIQSRLEAERRSIDDGFSHYSLTFCSGV